MASNEWIDQFKKRHNLSYKFICSKGDGVNTVVIEEWMGKKTLPFLEYYYYLFIYFFKKKPFLIKQSSLNSINLFPDKTYTVKGEKCHDRKLSKVRLTSLLCVSADGTQKLTLFANW